MDTKAFSIKCQAKYRVGGHFKEKALPLSLANQKITVDDKGSHVKTMFPNILADYQNPSLCKTLQWQIRHGKSSKTLPSVGGSASLTSPSGAPLPVVGFHLNTTTKRGSTPFCQPVQLLRLEELHVALPGDKSHSWYENPYNSRAYKRLSAEFSVAPDPVWQQKVDHGCQGLGSWSTFMTPSWSYRHAHAAQGPFFNPKDAIRHILNISGAWTTFVLDKSEGFTQAGVERLNDSIRTYVWAIMKAETQTRSNILKTGTGFDVQKQFLANIEGAIASPVDIHCSIARYQKTLGYASTALDFVCGIGRYLKPSDMALHPGNAQRYNNEIQSAGPDAAIGHNPGINEAEPINSASKGDKAFQGKTASPAETVHKGPSLQKQSVNPNKSDEHMKADLLEKRYGSNHFMYVTEFYFRHVYKGKQLPRPYCIIRILRVDLYRKRKQKGREELPLTSLESGKQNYLRCSKSCSSCESGGIVFSFFFFFFSIFIYFFYFFSNILTTSPPLFSPFRLFCCF